MAFPRSTRHKVVFPELAPMPLPFFLLHWQAQAPSALPRLLLQLGSSSQFRFEALLVTLQEGLAAPSIFLGHFGDGWGESEIYFRILAGKGTSFRKQISLLCALAYRLPRHYCGLHVLDGLRPPPTHLIHLFRRRQVAPCSTGDCLVTKAIYVHVAIIRIILGFACKASFSESPFASGRGLVMVVGMIVVLQQSGGGNGGERKTRHASSTWSEDRQCTGLLRFRISKIRLPNHVAVAVLQAV
mmetsp:Transcript_15292/g.27208  ORF Transcript_15292/g.27208 Transcript_15292/m.27208 type:complete len:242 (-) Transcript_15292:300-1025(-)